VVLISKFECNCIVVVMRCTRVQWNGDVVMWWCRGHSWQRAKKRRGVGHSRMWDGEVATRAMCSQGCFERRSLLLMGFTASVSSSVFASPSFLLSLVVPAGLSSGISGRFPL